MDALCQDNASPGMTPMQWCQAQAKDPAIHHNVDSIQNNNIKTFKNTGQHAFRTEGTRQAKEADDTKTRGSV